MHEIDGEKQECQKKLTVNKKQERQNAQHQINDTQPIPTKVEVLDADNAENCG